MSKDLAKADLGPSNCGHRTILSHPKVSGYHETESPGSESKWEALSATGLPGQEKRPRADIDVLVSASQAAAVLLQVVPGILVEVWHLVEAARLRTMPGTFFL